MPFLTIYCASCHAVVKREIVPTDSKTQTYGICDKCQAALATAPVKPAEAPAFSMSKNQIV